ncbi:MAG TPA: hypothetical protein VKX46_20030 [Ktedonobacteraceae bacterium]|nr:hypothetical protein [Ktedonobacteraceae bacterium]
MVQNQTQPIFCNENPLSILYAEAAGTPIAAVTFWRSFLSPVGSGHVLAVWRAQESGTGSVDLFTDHQELGKLIFTTFLHHWPPFHQERLSDVALQEAHFTVEADLPRLYRVACTAAGIDLLAEWRAVRSVSRHEAHTHADVRYNDVLLAVENTVGFCDQARILVNGQPLAGQMCYGVDSWESSAYVTLCETWS